jgi:hypothetical protein
MSVLILDAERQRAAAAVANYFSAELQQLATAEITPFTTWAESAFYISDTQRLIRFEMFQKAILNLIWDLVLNHGYQTVAYSDIKKSGKTTVAGAAARWVGECWGPYNEIFCMANDEEQARGRIYEKVQQSIELDPRYDKGRREIPHQWRIIRREIENTLNHSKIKSVSNDNRGEAGSNPTITLWSELWGFTSEDDKRFFEELTPVPTRAHSVRWIDSYAGYEGESELLYDIYERVVLNGERLTHSDIVPYGGWPFDDAPPIYVHEQSKTVAFWDEGPQARRLPWQTQAYYEQEAATLRPLQFERLHLNHWTSSVDSFIPLEWWNQCHDNELPELQAHEPAIIGVDASVSGDCTAAVLVTRHPTNKQHIAIRRCEVWKPFKGHKLDYTVEGGLMPTLIEWCKKYRVEQIAYDEFQLHHMMNELRQQNVAWCRVFSQNASRLKADKQLYDLIRSREIHHNVVTSPGSSYISEHIKNAAAKLQKDEDSKIRIIKKGKLPIDSVIALSMAAEECQRLTLV